MDSAHLLLNSHQLLRCHDLRQVIKWMMVLMTIQDVHLIRGFGVAKADIHHEAVKLGLRQGKRSLVLNGVLRSHDHEWLRQAVSYPIDGYLRFFHCFQQGRLGLWSGAVNFVGEHDLRHDGTGSELKVACFLVVDGDTSYITGQKIRSKLDTLECTSDRAGNSFCKHSFTHARHVFD